MFNLPFQAVDKIESETVNSCGESYQNNVRMILKVSQ